MMLVTMSTSKLTKSVIIFILICAIKVKYVLVQSSEYSCGTELECLQSVASTTQQQMQLMSEQLRSLRSQNSELLEAYRTQISSQNEVLKLQLELLRGVTSARNSNYAVLRSIFEYIVSSCLILVLVPVAQWLYRKTVSAYHRWQVDRTYRLWTRAQAEYLRTTLPHASSAPSNLYGAVGIVPRSRAANGSDIPLERIPEIGRVAQLNVCETEASVPERVSEQPAPCDGDALCEV